MLLSTTAFHLIISDPTAVVLGQELPALVKDGYTSFKVFMTYDDLVLSDKQLLEVFDCARRCSALVMVHCEGYDAFCFMTQNLEDAGKRAPDHPRRSPLKLGEREATYRAISHAQLTDVPLMIVHVSGSRVDGAGSLGAAERPQDLRRDLSAIYRPHRGRPQRPEHGRRRGARCSCSPPPRDVESQQAIWEGITAGVFQTFSSDHCPFRYDDPKGKLTPNARTSFRWVPNGIPGVETRLPILFSEGVSKGRITRAANSSS